MRHFLCLIAGLGLLLAACGGDSDQGSGSSAPKEVSKVLRINIANDPSALDPSLVEDVISNRVLQGLMDGLVTLDVEMNVEPAAAVSWEHNEDYTEWTFNLRPDAKWHNGDRVTAQDFKYGVERTCTKSTGANYAQIVYNFLEGGEEYYASGGLDAGLHLDAVEVVDDLTVRYHLRYPAPFFLTMVSFATWMPLNERAIEAGGPAWANDPATFVGNGPFRMAEFHSRQRLLLTRYEDYWDRDAIFWESIEFYMIDNENTEDQAFRSGEIDVTESVAVAQISQWKSRPEYRSIPALWTYYVGFNVEEPPFDNVLVRKAFSKAIDRVLIVERVTQGGEDPATGFVPTGMPGYIAGTEYRDAAGDMVGGMDLEEAARLLAEAGYGEGNPFPPVEYLYNTSDLHKKISEQLQFMWRDAFRVDVRLQNNEWGVMLDRLNKGDFQFARMNWIGDYADPLNFLEIFESTNSKNGPNFSNARYDALIEDARNEGDPGRRQELFIEAERILVEEECVIAPVFFQHVSLLIAEDLEGLEVNPLGHMTYVRARRVTK